MPENEVPNADTETSGDVQTPAPDNPASEEKPGSVQNIGPTPPSVSVPEPRPAVPVNPEHAASVLESFATLAMKHPEKPAMLLELAKFTPLPVIRTALLMAMPETWHHAMNSYFDAAEDDEIRLLACLMAVIFVQGMGTRHAIDQQSNGR